MLLNPPDGISCDCCGSKQRNEFTYYSIDMRQVEVVRNRFPDADSGPAIFSLDVCPSCLSQFEQAIRANYRPTSTGVNCDLCEAQMRGDFSFYSCRVSKVRVSFEHGSLVCKKCGVKTVSPGRPCKCGSTIAVKQADRQVDQNFLQMAVCPADYQQLQANAVRLRRVASELADSPPLSREETKA